MLISIARPFRHVHLESCASTQDMALDFVREAELVGLVSTFHQTRGRGRGDRTWLTPPGQALTFSAIQWPYADFSAMPFLGMAWAIGVANVCDAELQWPNDVVIQGKKIGGILTEVIQDPGGRRIAVVGIGINVSQTEFPPEIAHRATSLALAGRGQISSEALLKEILAEVSNLPEPTEWSILAPMWNARDATPGKKLSVPNVGDVISVGVDDAGNLLAMRANGSQKDELVVTSVGEVVYECSK